MIHNVTERTEKISSAIALDLKRTMMGALCRRLWRLERPNRHTFLLRCIWSANGRYCCKSPKISGDNFVERDEAELCSPINMAPRPLAKPPVSLSRGDKVPHIFA